MRTAIALAAAGLLLAGCGVLGEATPMTTPSDATTDTPTAAWTEGEVDYVREARIADPETAADEPDDLYFVNEGRARCGLDPFNELREVDPSIDMGSTEITKPTLGGLVEAPDYELAETARAIEFLCPKYTRMLAIARAGFADGEHTVGRGKGDVKPSTYRTVGRAVDCYWERSTAGGDIIDNRMVTNAPKGVRVTISATDGGFTSRGCGAWRPVG